MRPRFLALSLLGSVAVWDSHSLSVSSLESAAYTLSDPFTRQMEMCKMGCASR